MSSAATSMPSQTGRQCPTGGLEGILAQRPPDRSLVLQPLTRSGGIQPAGGMLTPLVVFNRSVPARRAVRRRPGGSSVPTPRDLLNEAKASIREVEPGRRPGPARGRWGHLPRRPRARRVRAGRHPQRRAPAPRPPRVPGGGQAARQVGPDRRLLRRRRALGLRRQDHGRPRLHRRAVADRRVQQLEGRRPALGGAADAHPGPAQPLPAPPPPARGRARWAS